MKCRLIKREVDANEWSALWELADHRDFTEPVIFLLKPKGPSLSIWGDGDFSEFINLENVPKDVKLARRKTKARSGVIFRDKGAISIIIYLPKGTRYLGKEYVDAIRTTAKKYGIYAFRSGHRIDSNDLVFSTDLGKTEKKFGAFMQSRKVLGGIITLDFNAKKIPGLYKLDHPKFKKRGDFKDISETVGGLNEAFPKITDDFVEECMRDFAARVGWTVRTAKMTKPEEGIIKKVLPIVSSDEWKLNAERL